LINRTELVSGGVVTICIAVSRAKIVGKFDTGTEGKRTIEGGQNG
jgi:hypothetical protein